MERVATGARQVQASWALCSCESDLHADTQFVVVSPPPLFTFNE